jgi:hypothetical protein
MVGGLKIFLVLAPRFLHLATLVERRWPERLANRPLIGELACD